jgi:O-antigen/teichoic acid export membrane protein
MTDFKTARNIVLYTVGEIIPRVLSFLLLPVLTKYLSTSDYGISSYINTVVTFLYVLTTLSINSFVLRTFYKVKTEVEKKKLLGNIFLFLSLFALIMLCLEALLFPVLLQAFSVKVPFYPYFLLGLILNFFDVVSVVPLITYRVNEDAKSFVMLTVGRTALQYIFVLFLIIYFNMGLLGSFAGRLIACVPFFFIYVFVVKKKGIFTINFSQIKEGLKFSLPLLPGALSYLVITMFDRIILERYVSLSELGIYSVASTLALTLNIVIQGLYRSFEQKIFKEHGGTNYLQQADKLYKFYVAALYIPAFGVILFAREILLFFTSSQYYAAETYVIYLVTAVIISGMNIFLGTTLIAEGKRKIISYSSFIAAVVSFIANVLFIKYFGVLGACIASIISFFVVFIFYYIKANMLRKYLIHQISFFTVFYASHYLVQFSLSETTLILIKLLLLTGFVFLIKMILKIQLPRVSFSKSFKVLKSF